MNDSGSELAYSTSTSGERLEPVHFGVSLVNERTRRVEIHFGDYVHITGRAGNTVDGHEAMFQNDRYYGVMAATREAGEADERTISLVETLAKYAAHPYHEYLGIRLAESYLAGYASCAVIRLQPSVSIEDLCAELAAL